MTVTVQQAVQALSALDRDDMLAAIQEVVGTVEPTHAVEAGTLLRLALDQDRLTETMAGPPGRVHTLVDRAFRDLQIKVEARRAVLSMDMLDSSAVAELLGTGGQNKREAASELRRRGRVIGLPVGGRRFVFPAFQFDPVERRVRSEVAAINVHLDAKDDPWGVASWWTSPQPRLDGAAPRDLLGTPRAADLLILAGAVDDG